MSNFINVQRIDIDSSCAEIIEWFNNHSKLQMNGVVAGDSGINVNKEKKDTTDITLNLNKIKCDEELSPIFLRPFQALSYCLEQYINTYSILKDCNITLHDDFNIQRYKKGQHFKNIHFESSTFNNRKRILVWMIYLNDVKKGGTTNFPYYNLRLHPAKSSVLIWPADFTHSHFGDIVEDEKYIMTGWFNMAPPSFSGKADNDDDSIYYFNV